LAVPREVGLAIKALGLAADINSLLLKLDNDWAPTAQVIAGGHQPWLDAARAGCPPSCYRQWPGPRIQPGQVASRPALLRFMALGKPGDIALKHFYGTSNNQQIAEVL